VINFLVNSGIGDISWLFSKLDEFSKEKEIEFLIAKDENKRSKPFVEMHPRIKFKKYSLADNCYVINNTIPFNTDLHSLEENKIHILSMNKWLETKNHMKDWFPDQPTNYYYDLNFSECGIKRAEQLLKEGNDRPKIGIYGSTYSTLRYWGFWDEKRWLIFIQKIREIYPDAIFYIIGAKFDIEMKDRLADILMYNNIDYVRVIGEDLDTALYVIKNLDYFFSFPSGLGIVANVLRTPCMMFMPGHLELMKYMFTEECDKKSGFFLNPLFIREHEAFRIWKDLGKKHCDARLRNT